MQKAGLDRSLNFRKRYYISKSMNLFFVLFFIFEAFVVFLLLIFYQFQSHSVLDSLKKQENYTVKMQKSEIKNTFSDIISDLIFLSRQNELQSYLKTGDEKIRPEIELEYMELALCKKKYGQIRYIDSFGQEVIRINYNKGLSFAVKRKNLQNKLKRYYFCDTIMLKKGEVFVSPLDLNIENGRLEKPFMPMIRLGIPVFDDKKKRGIVLINYLAQDMLDVIKRTSKTLTGSPMLLNDKGYWLLNRDSSKEWGFMLADRKDENFSRVFREEWKSIIDKKTGQIYTENGLFTFTTIYPLKNAIKSITGFNDSYISILTEINSDRYFWILLAHVSPDVLEEYIQPLKEKVFFLGIVFFILIAFGSFFLAITITGRKIYRNHLISFFHYDMLTSLPNRRFFIEKLEEGLSHSKRYGNKLGLLYIDIDGFKNVNDSFGHAAGDELLVKVSKRMLAVTRETDTVARIGGDEFAVVLFQVNDKSEIQIVGKKLINEINKPVNLKRGTVNVGASIGALLYPDTDQDPEELVKLADKAMYISKSKGKNICTMYELN